jgi:hypothetical protein
MAGPSAPGLSRRHASIRTIAAMAAVVVLSGATTAGAAKLLTGSDVKDGSLTGQDIKNNSIASQDLAHGSVGMGELKKGVNDAIPIRVTGPLPDDGFRATNGTVQNTPDGVTFGPYADGGSGHGSICSDTLDGETLNQVEHLAFEARYTAQGDTGGVGVPYLRIFLVGDHDAIFSPNTQPPDSDIGEGPFHTWVATAGVWRYDDDAGAGGEYGFNGAPFSTVKDDHGDEEISDVCISVGSTAGTNLSALLRTWEINSKDYAFGL